MPLASPVQEDEPPVVGFVVEPDSEEEEEGEEQAKVQLEIATTEKDKESTDAEEDKFIPLGSASPIESAGVIGAQAPGTIGAGGGNGISAASGNDGVRFLNREDLDNQKAAN